MLGSFYPYCSSTKRTYIGKSENINGNIYAQDGNLYFDAILSTSKSFNIPLVNIERVEAMNLNGVMPFGVCLFLKDGSECMLGHMRNKKLAAFINEVLLSQ